MRVLNEFSWKVAGEAGHGILNAGLMFARTCMRGGLNVFATAEYPSLIRGGHNHLDVRASERKIHGHTKHVSLLVALNMDSVVKHSHKILQGGGIIYDGNELKLAEGSYPGIRLYPVPLLDIANRCGGMIMRNTVAMGATIALADFDLELFNGVIRDNFGKKKGEDVAEKNIIAAKEGYDYVKKNFPDDFRFVLRAVENSKRIFISGNEAIAAGAVKAGCKFFAAYPMTPASSILHAMAAQERNYNIVVKHTEDEIAAINMTVGAAFAGARAMTATSGGGFALMVEGFGLAAQAEVPLVVVEAQRPGPATGMATHSGQGDLRFVLHASTDEFPRVVIAPGDMEQCYYNTIEAFNLAEKYQIPVVVLTDKYLGESFISAEKFSNDAVIDRGLLLSDEELQQTEEFRRFKVTESGVSPRSIPGQKGGEHTASSYEHDEHGFEREEEENRIAMHDKRFRKFENLKKEIKNPPIIGNGYSDITIVSWGSTKGPILDAIRMLEQDNIFASFLQVVYMSPFPSEQVEQALRLSRRTLIIENNKTSQLGSLIKEHTGLETQHKLLKYDGRPFSPEQIYEAVKKIFEDDEKKTVHVKSASDNYGKR
ncbi:MAG: 2-oxoacid:acceptor oxidoreductase subunit alpha [Candidatus Aenigmarchaeota archaeon]|nr:2-oxoacid:acceptor oxidoreductase subunit alpha [Candidatus Aenigmarchaeota archaeon]